MRIILTVLIVGVIAYLLYMNKPKKHEQSLEISVKEARSRRFGLIVDARTQNERQQLGYYPNSLLLSDVPTINKNTRILVYSGDNRAKNTAHMLHKMGYNAKYITQDYISLMPGY